MIWLLKMLMRAMMVLVAAAFVRGCGSEPTYTVDEDPVASRPSSRALS